MSFPDGFLWGAATSAYQVEGARDARGDSIWDTFAHTPGRVANGDTGDDAVDHLARFTDDVAIMRELGLTTYRFSVAWPRVQPDGRTTSTPGLEVYDRMVDELLAAGIEPMLTLYHWDLPQALEDRGGWRSRDTAGRFADYAEAVATRLGDRVRLWTTLNEPWCSAWLGHERGVHAPGLRDPDAAVASAHHLLLAHGLGVQAVRAAGSGRVELGITLNLARIDPAGDRPEDLVAAGLVDATQNRWWLDPVLHGRYPEEVLARTPALTDEPLVRDGDLALVAQPLDHLGVNYYRSFTVGSTVHHDGTRPAGPGLDDVVELPPEGPLTEMGWPVQPDGLAHLLVWLDREQGAPPLYVTETGAAYPDTPGDDGRVHDADRIAFLEAHVAAARDALAAGVDLRGFVVWSLMDNFEWAEGYRPTFGLVHVDRATQRRTPKDSAHWYAGLVARNGAP